METLDRMCLEQAVVSAGDVRVALRDALTGSTAVEAIVLLPLIERATTLARDIEALRDALTGSTAVEAIVLLPLIERATTLARDIEALLAARESDTKGGR